MPFQFRKEAIEEDLNSNFPSQGQGNPPLYYSLSEVVVPTYSINNVAEGSSLPNNLQTAWDFSTGTNTVFNTSATIINNPGFWQIDINLFASYNSVNASQATIKISDGLSVKTIWAYNAIAGLSGSDRSNLENATITVFLRSGDSVQTSTNDTHTRLTTWYRQIAELNGTLVNPLGYSAA